MHSVHYLLLRDALLSPALLNDTLFLHKTIIIQKFFILPGIVFHEKSLMKSFVTIFFWKQYTLIFRKTQKIQYSNKQLVLPSLFVY